ncbi:hypothetical protein L1887_48016 [Cichorium endivia]|nr:hypothetical protein L1887_48016 [Cichorium endivia]
MCDGKADPVDAEVGLHAQQRKAVLDHGRVVPELELEEGRFAEKVDVAAALDAECLGVALERLFEVLVLAVQDAESVPADERGQVESDALFGELDALFAAVGGAEEEALHGYGLAMLGELFEDGVCGLEAELVLFRLVLLDEPLEEGALLGGERSSLRRHGGRVMEGKRRRRWKKRRSC